MERKNLMRAQEIDAQLSALANVRLALTGQPYKVDSGHGDGRQREATAINSEDWVIGIHRPKFAAGKPTREPLDFIGITIDSPEMQAAILAVKIRQIDEKTAELEAELATL